MTSEGQRTLPADQAQASLRTELLGQLVAAQLALESAIAELSRAGGDAATLATAKSQLASLGDLRQQISTASIATLAAMRSEVAGVAAAAQASAQQTRDAATSAATTAVTDLAAKREAARQTIQSVTHDIFKRKIFDPYLQFASPGDEEAYRKRERENEAAIQRELARGTDKGNLRATELLERQFDDAGAHGADASPDFGRLREQNRQAMKTVREAMRDAPQQQSPPIAHEQTAPSKDSDLSDVMACLRSAGVGPAQNVTCADAGTATSSRPSSPDRGRL